jgi:hypothetical protein
MSNPMIRIHNQETGEVIDREMTSNELLEFEADQAAEATRQAAEAQKAAEKAALLSKLGITEDEAKLLLS